MLISPVDKATAKLLRARPESLMRMCGRRIIAAGSEETP